MWKKYIESNIAVSITIFIIFIVFLIPASIQLINKHNFDLKLEKIYNTVQDKFDLLMKNENITSFEESNWNKIWNKCTNKEITPEQAEIEYKKTISNGFKIDEDDIFLYGNALYIILQKDQIQLEYINGARKGDFGVLYIDVNKIEKPNIDKIDKFTLRINEDGTLSVVDKKLISEDLKKYSYLNSKRRKNATK